MKEQEKKYFDDCIPKVNTRNATKWAFKVLRVADIKEQQRKESSNANEHETLHNASSDII